MASHAPPSGNGPAVIKWLIETAKELKGKYNSLIAVTAVKIRPLFDHYANAGNIGIDETDLYSDNIVANTLVDNGDKLEFMYAGILDGALVNKSISIYFGGDLLFALPNQNLESMEWQISGTIIKSSNAEYKYTIEYHSNDSLGLSGTSAGTTSAGSGINFFDDNILKLTGTSAGSSDEVVARLGSVKWISHA